jgi:predicted dehydrogenase
MTQADSARPSRRDFLKTSSALAAATAVGSLPLARSAHAAGSDVLRVGLIGCGGRGTGAAVNALNADPGAKIVALADGFEDRLRSSLASLEKQRGDRVAVDADHQFVGFDAGKRLIGSGVDVVLLCEPPHFRPIHLEAAVAAGKHVFCEKPVAVDAPGVRRVLAACEEAEKKGLSIVSGLCWRYNPEVRETMQRVLDGAIGDIQAVQVWYNTGTLWSRGRQPDWTEMQFQLRNWYYFTWLSGDHNVEQHIHSLDKALWAMRDEPPVRAWGMGGRQVRTDPMFGDIYDHHAVLYEYPGANVYAYTRQMANCWNQTADLIIGTKGKAHLPSRCRIEGENPWRYEGPGGNMYDIEHQELFASIRAGKGHNDGVFMARSTMLAVMGRMVTYTGQNLTWEQALGSQEDLSPKSYAWDADPPTLPGEDGRYPVAMPGLTKFV